MPEFTNEQSEKILAALHEANVSEPCPRCANTQFVLLDGYANIMTSPGVPTRFIVSGPAIPTILTVCQRCGYIAQHAIGALGLLNPEEESDVPAPAPRARPQVSTR